MHTIEKNAIKVVAKIAPWLAPFPSAYFVARSAMVHLAMPFLVAVIVAAIIETLGLATVHTALWAFDWNASKRKSDPSAPATLSVTLGGVYIVAMGLLCLHLSHGFSSFFQTLGLRSGRTQAFLNGLGIAYALVIFLGNISIPISILAKLGPFANS